MKQIVKELHELLKQRAEEVEKAHVGEQAVFAIKLGHYRHAFDGMFPIDYCAEEWANSKNVTEKRIHELLLMICEQTRQPEPRPLSRIGCVTCDSVPLDAKLRGVLP